MRRGTAITWLLLAAVWLAGCAAYKVESFHRRDNAAVQSMVRNHLDCGHGTALVSLGVEKLTRPDGGAEYYLLLTNTDRAAWLFVREDCESLVLRHGDKSLAFAPSKLRSYQDGSLEDNPVLYRFEERAWFPVTQGQLQVITRADKMDVVIKGENFDTTLCLTEENIASIRGFLIDH